MKGSYYLEKLEYFEKARYPDKAETNNKNKNNNDYNDEKDSHISSVLRVVTDEQKHALEIKHEYERKLKELTKLINSLLPLHPTQTNSVDNSGLDDMLQFGLEVMKFEGKRYALVPVKDNYKGYRRRSKTKKNDPCPFCGELVGHLRENCVRRLSISRRPRL